MNSLISIQNLSIAFREKNRYKHVVSKLNLDITSGQCLGLVGESGSGKSLTGLSIMQLLPFAAVVGDQSRILWEGRDLLSLSEKEMRTIRYKKIGMIFQDAMSAFNPVLTIGQQIKEVLKKHCDQPEKKAWSLLSEVGIEDPGRVYVAYPHQLSGGMRQRAMIAMTLSGNPSLIIADEPTTALDVTVQAQIIALLRALKDKHNLTLLFISHDLSIVSQIADDIVVLRSGKLIEQASRQLFYVKPQNDYTKQLLAAIPPLRSRQKMSEEKSNKILTIKNVKVYFPIVKGLFSRRVGYFKAVNNVSFDLQAGKTLALVGESGSGKTTLARAIVHLVSTAGGSVFFQGKDLLLLSERKMRSIRSDIQMVFQDPYTALNPRRMIGDSLLEAVTPNKIIQNRKEKINYIEILLEKVGLNRDCKWRYPHEFSGGERQRICIARALAMQPKLLILDEPTSALDVSMQMQILMLLEKLQKENNLSYLLITHNLGVVAYLAHEVAVMKKGEIVEVGSTELLLQNPTNSYTKQLLAAIPRDFQKGENK